MPPLPDHVLVASTRCAPDCRACPGGPPPQPPPPGASGLVYLCWEALDGSPAVARALRAVPAHATPVLVTHGAGRVKHWLVLAGLVGLALHLALRAWAPRVRPDDGGPLGSAAPPRKPARMRLFLTPRRRAPEAGRGR